MLFAVRGTWQRMTDKGLCGSGRNAKRKFEPCWKKMIFLRGFLREKSCFVLKIK
jgi:hypothetical protein